MLLLIVDNGIGNNAWLWLVSCGDDLVDHNSKWRQQLSSLDPIFCGMCLLMTVDCNVDKKCWGWDSCLAPWWLNTALLWLQSYINTYTLLCRQVHLTFYYNFLSNIFYVLVELIYHQHLNNLGICDLYQLWWWYWTNSCQLVLWPWWISCTWDKSQTDKNTV